MTGLRAGSGGRHGVDELMRRAYARYSGVRGFTPEPFEAIAAVDQALRSCEELDSQEVLAWLGLAFAPAADDAPREQRWRLQVRADATAVQQDHLRPLLLPTPGAAKRGVAHVPLRPAGAAGARAARLRAGCSLCGSPASG